MRASYSMTPRLGYEPITMKHPDAYPALCVLFIHVRPAGSQVVFSSFFQTSSNRRTRANRRIISVRLVNSEGGVRGLLCVLRRSSFKDYAGRLFGLRSV